ncbi:MAG TPA: SHOCT domain-containing protein [Gaiellaceae bacterium]|nr:SHOCT domain-containing protein [Gaiellaceae bacterium]
MVFAETTFLDVFWYMLLFFLWVMFFWVFISVVADIFRRDDMSGWAKAGWLLLIIVLPLLGILIYVIARPKVTAQDVKMLTQAEAASRAAAGVSTADELAKLKELHNQGVLSDTEYESLKQKAIS